MCTCKKNTFKINVNKWLLVKKKGDVKAPREAPKYEFLRAHSRPGSAPMSRRPQTARETSDTGSELAAAAATAHEKKAKDDIDFIKHNQQLAKQVRMRRAPSVEMLKNLQEKTNKQFEAYMADKKGRIPE